MPKIAYLHGRLGPHIMHGRLAKSVNAEFQFIDEYKKWNDGEYSKFYLIYAWLYNAFAFKGISMFKYFLISGPHFSPVIMKMFRLRKDQKIIAHLGDETMYFLYSNWYSKFMKKVLVGVLNRYDALLCEGKMASELAELNGINKPIRKVTYLGVPEERMKKLQSIQTDLNSNHLVFISSGPKGWRTHYKGLDLMLDAYSLAFEKNSSLEFSIIGEWDEELQNELCKDMDDSCVESIHFLGHQDHLEEILKTACFYYHVARGDAFPTVVLEAMSAGLIPLVSEWTGSKEVVGELGNDHIVSLNKEKISESLLMLTQMNQDQRKTLSNRSRELSSKFTEDFALSHYQATFEELDEEFKVRK